MRQHRLDDRAHALALPEAAADQAGIHFFQTRQNFGNGFGAEPAVPVGQGEDHRLSELRRDDRVDAARHADEHQPRAAAQSRLRGQSGRAGIALGAAEQQHPAVIALVALPRARRKPAAQPRRVDGQQRKLNGCHQITLRNGFCPGAAGVRVCAAGSGGMFVRISKELYQIVPVSATFYLRSTKNCDRMTRIIKNALRRVSRRPSPRVSAVIFAKGLDRAVERWESAFREGALLRAPAVGASAFPREPPTERAGAQVGSGGSLRYRSECAVSAANCGWYRGS